MDAYIKISLKVEDQDTLVDIINTLRTVLPYMADNVEIDLDDSDFNVWGTEKSDINADEFCVECEREVPYHYENCPLHRSNNGE